MAGRGISIVICCFNSASRLPETLHHLALQQTADVPWEIIIVDNASTDNTKYVAHAICKQDFYGRIDYKIIEEPTPGLTYARERGCKESVYSYILFCDDDNWLCENYVYKGFQIMENDVKIGVLGGRSEAVADIPFPFWFSTVQNCYAVGVQSINSGDVSDKGYVWGSGMFLRKSVLDRLLSSGFKPLLTDRSGKNLSSGGDSEICKWFLIAGYKLWYSEDLVFKHYLPENRLQKTYLENLTRGFTTSVPVLNEYDYFINHILHKSHFKIKHVIVAFYHGLNYLLFRKTFSRQYIAVNYPLQICRLLDPKYYAIRKSYNDYRNVVKG